MGVSVENDPPAVAAAASCSGGPETTAAAAAATTTSTTSLVSSSDTTPVLNGTNHPQDDYGDYTDGEVRRGTVSSARFNILSTMVGGGCLSLPLAFQQSGNALVGPLMLLATGIITDFCFRLLVASALHLNRRQHSSSSSGQSSIRPGKDTFESVTSAAFGPKAYVFSMTLVVLMCFFGAVGYSVLLRDMMEPVNDAILAWVGGGGGGGNHTTGGNNNQTNHTPTTTSWSYDDTTPTTTTMTMLWETSWVDDLEDPSDDPQLSWLHKNLTLFLVILLVTPFCTLRHLTALKDCGAASMTSVLVLGSCIVFRSVQCNINSGGSGGGSGGQPWYTYLTFFPASWRDLLDVVPLYISCFVCHYNILPVHNELQDPTPARVSWWLRSTTWFAVTLYMIMGLAGSSYAHCTGTGRLQGNILLDFDENDPLLFVGRMCLAVTITLAFPMLVIPARDIMIRSWIVPMLHQRRQHQRDGQAGAATEANEIPTQQEQLREPLLAAEENPTAVANSGGRGSDDDDEEDESVADISFSILLATSIVIFWTAGAVASCVESIDIVWDLLGSSLSILLSYLIPAATYLVITKRGVDEVGETNDDNTNTSSFVQKGSRILCWCLLLFFLPLMVVSTANAVINTFF